MDKLIDAAEFEKIHASYPFFVHRPAISPWASSAPRLATTHLPFG